MQFKQQIKVLFQILKNWIYAFFKKKIINYINDEKDLVKRVVIYLKDL